MIDYLKCVMAILKKEDGTKYFIRGSNKISSILTVECLFSREKAWAVSREFNEIHGKNNIIVFRTVGENTDFIGKTPEEILACKKEALLNFCRQHKSNVKEKREITTKKKKTSAQINQGGLFGSLGENREADNENGQSRDNRPYNIF